MPESLKKLVRMESAGGLLLMAATGVALLVANSPLSAYYDVLLDTPLELLEGHLSSASRVALPAIAAVGGMAVPALIYAYLPLRERVTGERSLLKELGTVSPRGSPSACCRSSRSPTPGWI